MTTKETKEYYRSSLNSAPRPELQFALKTISDNSIVVDCGCGAGSDIALLRSKGHTVYAFDIDEESIKICEDRFTEDDNVFLSQASFGTYSYPESSLVVADASLFFCPENEFNIFMGKIRKSLHPGGIFCGSFLGKRDTMNSENFNRHAFWGDVLVLTEGEIKNALKGFDIMRWKEFETDGFTPNGKSHHWHIFIVVAKLTRNSR